MKPAVLFFLSFIFLPNSNRDAEEPRSRIYIANHDHTDLMWTADAETYARVFVEMLDFHLKLADDTAGHAMPYRHRFNCDGSYWLLCDEHKKSPPEFARLVERIRDGVISAPLNAVVSCYGGQPAEAVLRGMYFSERLERKYGLRLLLKWHSLVPPGNQQSGGYSEAFDPVAAVKFLDSDPAFLARYRGAAMTEPYRVRAAFGFGWDALDRKTGQPYPDDPKAYPMVNHFHLIAKELSNDQRQVIVSNEVDFFEDFEKTHGRRLVSESVTYGNEWDLYSASMSETSARVKRAVEKLRSAELLTALVSLKEPDFMRKHTQARDIRSAIWVCIGSTTGPPTAPFPELNAEPGKIS